MPGLDFFGIELFWDQPNFINIVTVILDLLLVSYIIYRFLALVRGTRAFLMIIGLILLLALSSFISKYLNLFTIQWLLANVFKYFFLFIIIIFQNEIRRALTRLGSGMKFFAKEQKVREIFEEVIEAVDRMAQIKQGAIIVFERDAKVEDQILTMGQVLDSKISKEIIWAIFRVEAENPLHDGAIIIRNNRISRGGVLLPLSNNKLSEKYGTRHRAALGISEHTDAIVLVVSEERGTISICEGGKLVAMENLTRLRSELGRLAKKQALSPNKWWKNSKPDSISRKGK